MDAYELSEEILDLIAAERQEAQVRMAHAADRMDKANAIDDRRSYSEASHEHSRHMEAVAVLQRALDRCQRFVNEAYSEVEESDDE
jgi:hypothetical protein